MSISRRGFFGLLAAGTAVAVTPQLAELLVPKRTIFLPPKGGWKLSKMNFVEAIYDIGTDSMIRLDSMPLATANRIRTMPGVTLYKIADLPKMDFDLQQA